MLFLVINFFTISSYILLSFIRAFYTNVTRELSLGCIFASFLQFP